MLFLLSFANMHGSLGVAIVEASNFRNAVLKCIELEIHPGGFCRMGDAPPVVHESWMNTLLDRDDATAIATNHDVTSSIRRSSVQ